MSAIKKLITKLIEEQNVIELADILDQNPQIDLNSLSNNNLSALWLALCPKTPKLPSLKIIELLVARNQIDPRQLYNGQTVRAYHQQQIHQDKSILNLLTKYENDFIPRVNNNVQEDARLRRFADHGQNVHSAVVEDSVKKSASSLYQRYIKNTEFNWSKILQDLELWISLDGYTLNFESPTNDTLDENTLYLTLKNNNLFYTCIDAKTKQQTTNSILDQINWKSPLTLEQIKPHLPNLLSAIKEQRTSLKSLGLNLDSAKKSFDRISNLELSYQCSGEISLTCKQALALTWIGLSSTVPEDFVENIDMSSNEVHARNKLMIENLINIQNEYGVDVPSCVGGTFNHLISRLDCIHTDVRISESVTFTPELISNKYLAFSKKKLLALLSKNPALFWKYIQYYHFDYLSTDSDNKCSEIIIEFNERTLAEFNQQIQKENKELKDEDKRTNRNPAKHMRSNDLMETLKKLTGSTPDEGLPIHNLTLLNIIVHFFHKINYFTTNCFGFGSKDQNESIKELMNKIIGTLITNETTSIEQIFDELKTSLSQSPIDLSALENHLQPLSESYGDFFNTLEKNRKEDWLNRYWSFYAKSLPRTPIDNKDDHIFWELLKEDFFRDLPLLQKWFSTLPEDLGKEFINSLIQKEYHLDYKNHTSEIRGLALNLALKEKYLSDFPLNEPLIFKNQDLKGVDLSSLNLEHLTFINCNLTLTNILNNPTFNHKHIDTNQFDFQIFRKINDLLEKNSDITLGIDWLNLNDQNVLIYLNYLVEKNYFHIANLILKSYPNLKFYGAQNGEYLNRGNSVFSSITNVYECLGELRRYFRCHKDNELLEKFLGDYKQLIPYIDNEIENLSDENEKIRSVLKSLAKLINSLSIYELQDMPALPCRDDLNLLEIDEELRNLLNQSTYAQVASENNFLESIFYHYRNIRLRGENGINFISGILSHPSLSINLFTRVEGISYNPFDSLVSSAVENGPSSALKLLLNNNYLTFSEKELNIIRSQFFKAISKHHQTHSTHFHSLYKLFFASQLYSFKACHDWMLQRINFDKKSNTRFFTVALFSKEFDEHFPEFNEAYPELIQESFKSGMNEAVNPSKYTYLNITTVLCHSYCDINTLSLVDSTDPVFKQSLLNIICNSEEIKNKFLNDLNLSEFVKNNLVTSIEAEIDNLPPEWKFQDIKEEWNHLKPLSNQEQQDSQKRSDEHRVERFKTIYKALYEGQSSCSLFKHWNSLVDKEDLTVGEIEAYLTNNKTSRSATAWALTNTYNKDKNQLFREIHNYAYANSSCVFGLFRQTRFSADYDNLQEIIDQKEEGSRTDIIMNLLKSI